MNKIVIKIVQGNVVTQIIHITWDSYIYRPILVANFLQYVCAKNYENWLTVDIVLQ